LVMTAVAGLVATMGARSFAGPLLPTLPTLAEWLMYGPGYAVAGESTLYVVSGSGNPITVDWIVVFWGNVGPGGKPVWGYYYQLENRDQPSTGKTIAAFTINTPFQPFFNAGFIADQSLDVSFTDIGPVPGHTAANYPNLGPPGDVEFEPSPGNIQNPTSTPIADLYDTSFSFANNEIGLKNQSAVLIGYAFAPPTYGTAHAENGYVQWKGIIPVPSPEPNVVVLLAMGLMGIGIARRRNKKA